MKRFESTTSCNAISIRIHGCVPTSLQPRAPRPLKCHPFKLLKHLLTVTNPLLPLSRLYVRRLQFIRLTVHGATVEIEYKIDWIIEFLISNYLVFIFSHKSYVTIIFSQLLGTAFWGGGSLRKLACVVIERTLSCNIHNLPLRNVIGFKTTSFILYIFGYMCILFKCRVYPFFLQWSNGKTSRSWCLSAWTITTQFQKNAIATTTS